MRQAMAEKAVAYLRVKRTDWKRDEGCSLKYVFIQ